MVSNSEKLSKWAILSVQDPTFLESVKLAYVCDSGNQAFLVTKDDDVFTIENSYIIIVKDVTVKYFCKHGTNYRRITRKMECFSYKGTNNSGCSGIDSNTRGVIGGNSCMITCRKVDALCKKEITKIVCSRSPHVLAITKSGKVYSWGCNSSGELGHGTTSPNVNCNATIISKLDQFRVKQVACGYNHSMALTRDGKVYTWGTNGYSQVGNGSTANCYAPYHNTLDDAKCEVITCTALSSYAVTDRGKVYSWGYNGNGELGIGSTTTQSSPKQIITFDNQVITKIVGGINHVLALTDDGLLYTWGYNSNGQLGTGNTTGSNVPVQVGNSLGRFFEIASSIFNNNLSAGMASNEKVYVWGNFMGKSIFSPVLTSHKQIDDVFSSSTLPYAMWRNLTLDTSTTSTAVAQQLGQNFNNKVNSDFEFVFSGNKGPIYAHKAILKIRSEYFNRMFSSTWTEAKQNRQEIKDYRYEIYKAYIQYLYTNIVDLAPCDAVELMQLADKNCENDLKKRCETLIIRGITTDNVLNLITMATNLKLQNLEEQCYKYAINHMTAVVKSDAFKGFDKDLEKKLISMVATLGVFKT